MRNRFKGICYRCKKVVEVGDGHFERRTKPVRHWVTIHAQCVFNQRKEKLYGTKNNTNN